MKRRTALAILFGFWTALCGQDAMPSAEAVLDRFTEVTGGKEAYAKRKTEIMTARMDFAAAGLAGKITRYAAEPDQYYSTMELPGIGAVEMGVNGGVAWEKSAILGPRIKTGAERAEAIREATLNSTANWRKLYPKVKIDGTETVDGEECYKVVMQPTEGNPITTYFQKKSGLAVKMTTVATSQMGDVPVTIIVADYKNFGGVLAPAKTTQKAAGQEFTITVEKVEVNASIPASRFALPDDIQALAAKAAKQ
jgi:hypothetical protein